MADNPQLSQTAYDRLKVEHTKLTTAGRIDIAKKIETARELGDLKENGDYHAAKEEKGKMEGRIMHLVQILENAEIVESTGSDAVLAGSVVESCQGSPPADIKRQIRTHPRRTLRRPWSANADQRQRPPTSGRRSGDDGVNAAGEVG